MLRSLHISNYALIDCIDLELHPGLNIITGETGAGKSIMLGALSLLLGGRADTKSIRHADVKSVIEAVFDVAGNDSLRRYCQEADLDWDDSRLILRREISQSGRSRAFVNDTPVTIERLREIGLQLVDIHSQHQNQLLSSPAFQLDIIDTLAANGERLKCFGELYTAYRTAVHKLKATKAAVARDRENEDFMRYQLLRFDELDLHPDELPSLEAERVQLAEAAEVREYLDNALGALSAADVNVMTLLSVAGDAVAELAEVLPEEARIAERIENLKVELSDIAETIEQCASLFSHDAASELEAVEDRIRRINSVMSRHNVASADELLATASRIRQRLERLEDSETIIADLEKQARVARKKALEGAARITEARREAADAFARQLHDTAMPLGMKNLTCDIAVEPADLSSTGADKVEFRFAFNKNQQPLTVGAAASGGEISRLMLSIKSIIASRMNLPSIVFDEVDTGVSGDVADRMGRMMHSIGENLQVIAITHLPQVAAKGAHHYKVFKRDTDTTTVTRVEELDADGRIGEIALMLSGDANDATARATASTLLSKNN